MDLKFCGQTVKRAHMLAGGCGIGGKGERERSSLFFIVFLLQVDTVGFVTNLIEGIRSLQSRRNFFGSRRKHPTISKKKAALHFPLPQIL